MTSKTSLSFVKITKYDREGNITSSNYVDAFENAYKTNVDSNKNSRARGNKKVWGDVVIKTCPLCSIRYTAKESAGERCYRCQYHIYRIAKKQEFKGFIGKAKYNETSSYLKRNPEILNEPIGGWHKERHLDSLKELERMENAK